MPKLFCNKYIFLPSTNTVLPLRETRIPKKFSAKTEQEAVPVELSLSRCDLRVFNYTTSARILNSYMRGQVVVFSCWTKPSEGSGTDFKRDMKNHRNLATVNLCFRMKWGQKKSPKKIWLKSCVLFYSFLRQLTVKACTTKSFIDLGVCFRRC